MDLSSTAVTGTEGLGGRCNARVRSKPIRRSQMAQESAKFRERHECIGCGSVRLDEVCSGRYDEGPVEQFIASDPWGEHPAPFLVGQRWSYVRCNDCEQAFHRYILTPEWNERRFSR